LYEALGDVTTLRCFEVLRNVTSGLRRKRPESKLIAVMPGW
jgi:hypothetical protein